MARDPARVEAQLVAALRAHTDNADDAELRAALATLTPAEEKTLRQLLRRPPSGHFSPSGWADLARGTDPQVAVARELSGYYHLLTERDALAAVFAGHPAGPKVKTSSGVPGPRRRARKGDADRVQHLLALFAYYRDAPSVARTLGIPLDALDAELEVLGIRRRAYRIARGSDAQMPVAKTVPGRSGPPIRRRTAKTSAAAPPAEQPALPSESEALKALLAEVGPRRTLLAERLGVSGGALLARFRSAGLERELALRERDLIRALWSKHRGAESKVAAELRTTPEALREIAIERGIARELESIRERFRREALRRRWPRERIEQVLDQRDELRELGVLDGLEREVAVRAGVIWTSLQGKRDALELFAKKLRLTRDDAVRLQKLLGLG